MSTLTATITDGASFAEALPVAWTTGIADFMFVDDFPPFSPGAVAVWGVFLSSGIGVHAVTSRAYQAGALVTEGLRLASPIVVKGKYKVTRVEALRFREALRQAFRALLVQGLGFHDANKVIVAIKVIEKLRLSSSVATVGRYQASLLQVLHVHDVAKFFLGGAIAEGLGLHDSPQRQYQGVARLTQNIGLAALLGGSLLFRADVADGVGLTHLQLVKAIYRGDPLIDTVNLWVAYVDPGGGFTTWAVNTRTSAVTEYENFVFNSITKRGNKFYGATTDGLYELDGEQDDGASIGTRIKTGLMQMAGSKFTSFKAIYLGLKIKDDATDVLVKLHAGDGREYVYAVKPNDTATTRVNTGKGLRSRYFSFELETVGADYDLDTVEFVPISSKRRI